jgi:hypothetical protein
MKQNFLDSGALSHSRGNGSSREQSRLISESDNRPTERLHKPELAVYPQDPDRERRKRELRARWERERTAPKQTVLPSPRFNSAARVEFIIRDPDDIRPARNIPATEINGKAKPPSANGHTGKLGGVYQQAKAHCANYCRDGTCVGTDCDLKTGRHFRWRAEGARCLLALDQRCPYFEESVLPMEKRREKDWPTFAQGEAFRKAARLYHDTFPETVPVQLADRMCPDCGKRRIEPRKRCCSECRIRRRKATNAANQRKWQKSQGSP